MGRHQQKTERSQGCSVTEQCGPPTCGHLGGKRGLFQLLRPFCVGPALLLLAPTPACPFLALWASQEHGPVLPFPSSTPLSSTGRYLKPWCRPPPHESRGGRLTVTAQSPALFVFKKDSRKDFLGDRTRQLRQEELTRLGEESSDLDPYLPPCRRTWHRIPGRTWHRDPRVSYLHR